MPYILRHRLQEELWDFGSTDSSGGCTPTPDKPTDEDLIAVWDTLSNETKEVIVNKIEAMKVTDKVKRQQNYHGYTAPDDSFDTTSMDAGLRILGLLGL